MARFSDYFRLGQSQYQLDFVDIPLETDVRLYVDPFAIGALSDPWSEQANDLIVSYFEVILRLTAAGRHTQAIGLLSRLSEPNQTHLGLSTREPAGRSLGRSGASAIHTKLLGSKALRSGLLQDLSDCELLVPGVGRDKISDVATNIIFGPLFEFTKSQCDFHGIPTRPVAQVLWDAAAERWKSVYVQLPVVKQAGGESAVVLVPKYIVRLDLAYDTREYYQGHILDFLQAEYVNAGDSLVTLLKNGRKRVYKKDIAVRHPPSSEFIVKFSTEHPEVLQQYRSSVEDPGPVPDPVIESREPDPREFDPLEALASIIRIRPGNAGATQYHRAVKGLLTALFYPQLTRFEVEQEINEGRKRLDILADNVATKGFFASLRPRYDIPSPYVPFECKNYSQDLANPEIDQMIGRLSARRGKLGIIVCRRVDDRGTLLKRCKDALHDQGVVVLFLDDLDLEAMVHALVDAGLAGVDSHLHDRIREVLL
jgi:hypothetical protein